MRVCWREADKGVSVVRRAAAHRLRRMRQDALPRCCLTTSPSPTAFHLRAGLDKRVVALAAHVLQHIQLRRKVGQQVRVQGAGRRPRKRLLRWPHHCHLQARQLGSQGVGDNRPVTLLLRRCRGWRDEGQQQSGGGGGGERPAASGAVLGPHWEWRWIDCRCL